MRKGGRDCVRSSLHPATRFGRYSAASGDSPPIVDGDVLLRLSSGWLLRRYGLRHGDLAWARPVAAPATEGWTGLPVVADRNWYLSTGETLVAYGERVGRLSWTRDSRLLGLRGRGGGRSGLRGGRVDDQRA